MLLSIDGLKPAYVVASELRVMGAPHHAHATFAELGEDAVLPDL